MRIYIKYINTIFKDGLNLCFIELKFDYQNFTTCLRVLKSLEIFFKNFFYTYYF